MKRLLVAVSFLTIAPVGASGRVADEELRGSLAWFPLVGLLIGAVLTAAHWLCLAAFRDTPPTGALVLSAWVALTGAVHLDGLGDACDGLYAGNSREERLRIMKDPHVGAIAVVAIVCLLLLKYAALCSLAGARMRRALWLAPSLGRYAMVWLGTTLPYARPERGTGAGFVRTDGPGAWRALACASASMIVLAWIVWQTNGLVLGLLAGLATWWLGRVFLRRLGGVTGDTLGAAGELVETLVLLAAAAHPGRG